MISVIAGGLVFAAMTYCGMIIKREYDERYKMLKNLSSFCSFMLREITLYKTPVANAINKYIMTNEGNHKFLTAYTNLTNKNYQEVYKLTDYIYLKKTDRALITDLFVSLGKGNLKEEKKFLEQFSKDIDAAKTEALELRNKDGKLYYRLLSLAGFALMIIIV